MKKISKFFTGSWKVVAVILMAVFLVIPIVSAKTDAGNIYIGPDEVINHNVYKVGNSIVIEGTINGDVYAWANSVSIKGEVNGDVFAGGNTVSVSGKVGGNIFAFGQNVMVISETQETVRAFGSNLVLNSKVGKNAYLFGSTVAINRDTVIGWDLSAFGMSVDMAGQVNRNADFRVQNLTISNAINGNVNVYLDEQGTLSLLSDARVGGDLNYFGNRQEQLTLSSGSEVTGQTSFKALEVKQEKAQSFWSVVLPIFAFFKIAWLVSFIVVGLLMIWMIPNRFRSFRNDLGALAASDIGWGFVIFILIPAVALFLAVTLIGLPLSALLMAGYFVALFVSQVVAVIVLGMAMVDKLKKTGEPGLVVSLLVGAIIYFLITLIPFVGWAVRLVVIWLGLGMLRRLRREALNKINE